MAADTAYGKADTAPPAHLGGSPALLTVSPYHNSPKGAGLCILPKWHLLTKTSRKRTKDTLHQCYMPLPAPFIGINANEYKLIPQKHSKSFPAQTVKLTSEKQQIQPCYLQRKKRLSWYSRQWLPNPFSPSAAAP